MTQDEILDMWGRAGGGAIDHMPYALVEHFAKLVAARTLMKIDPSSFMSYQEGFKAGRLAEREACAKIIDDSWETTKAGEGIPEDWLLTLSELIRARGEA